ncbi:MAG: SDR family oxidoreductase, partial [Syntrophobacterales bacterium]|nr:SDR family oxidoreductase [Syntrophobacterales bacterium]
MSDICYGLKDKVVVVTGGSRGIGLEIAGSLLREEAKVVICGRKSEGLDAAADILGGGGNLMTFPAHIAKEADVNALFDAVIDRFSRLDVLINNVGMNIMTLSVADTEPALWQKIMDTNLNGTFFCSRKAAAVMKEQGGGGRIVNISSIAGRKASPG